MCVPLRLREINLKREDPKEENENSLVEPFFLVQNQYFIDSGPSCSQCKFEIKLVTLESDKEILNQELHAFLDNEKSIICSLTS